MRLIIRNQTAIGMHSRNSEFFHVSFSRNRDYIFPLLLDALCLKPSLPQLLQHYNDRNLAFQFQLDDVEWIYDSGVGARCGAPWLHATSWSTIGCALYTLSLPTFCAVQQHLHAICLVCRSLLEHILNSCYCLCEIIMYFTDIRI